MKVINFQNFVLLAITFICTHSCKRDDAPQNPCANPHPTSAEFTVQDDLMKRYNSETNSTFSCDTQLTGPDVYFTSKYDYDTYTWTIIGDPNYLKSTKSFSLWFQNPGYIDVMLIGKRAADTRCIINDDGVDTMIRHIVFVDSPMYYGRYYGYEVSKPDKPYGFEVGFAKIPTSNNPGFYTRYFPDSCTTYLQPSPAQMYFSYRLINYSLFDSQGIRYLTCSSPNGWAFFGKNGGDINVDIKYRILNPPDDIQHPIQQHYIGTRIH